MLSFVVFRVANFIMMGYGVGMGWLTTALPLLQSNETPLDTGPITTEQLSWAGSIMSIGALLSNLTFGYLTSKIGSKHATLILGVPQMVSGFGADLAGRMGKFNANVWIFRFCHEGLLVFHFLRAASGGFVHFAIPYWLCPWRPSNLQCFVYR